MRSRGGLSRELIAGVSVAVVVIPQALAYAQLAGLPPARGLYAAALPALAGALLAASPAMQAGPAATSSLLVFGGLTSLAAPGSPRYVQLAMLLAVVVGAVRLLMGFARLGWVARLLTAPVLTGFTPAAAILIAASQVPAALGAHPPHGQLLVQAGWSLAHAAAIRPATVALALGTVIAIVLPRRRWPLFPGVLVATLVGIAATKLLGYRGATIGSFASGLPPLSLALPWASLPALLVPGLVLAIAGFAEPAAVARAMPAEDGSPWDADRELIGQGAANVVAGLSGGFPVSASLSRSALNHLLGARTRWSAAVTAVTVIALLPWCDLLTPLPTAVLAGVVLAAISRLVRLRPLHELWAWSRPQWTVAAVTFVLTLVCSPHVERALVVGVALAVGVHLWREQELHLAAERRHGVLRLAPAGVLFFGTAERFSTWALAQLGGGPAVEAVEAVEIDLSGIGRLDVCGAHALEEVRARALSGGLAFALVRVPPQSTRVLAPLMREPTTIARR